VTRYPIKECFYSLQGEGVRAGCPSIFLRFSGCNLKCRKETHGFDCDTEHQGGEALTVEEIVRLIDTASPRCQWVVLTGGEPALFMDAPLVAAIEQQHHYVAVETNGTLPLRCVVDWIAVSPKRGAKLVLQHADEVRVVVSAGDPLPQVDILTEHRLLSPAFVGDTLPPENLEHCINLCLENPQWRLSVQLHKMIGVR
jgi:organic radical activating enzyme